MTAWKQYDNYLANRRVFVKSKSQLAAEMVSYGIIALIHIIALYAAPTSPPVRRTVVNLGADEWFPRRTVINLATDEWLG